MVKKKQRVPTSRTPRAGLDTSKRFYRSVPFWIDFYPGQMRYGYDIGHIAISGGDYPSFGAALKAAQRVIDASLGD